MASACSAWWPLLQDVRQLEWGDENANRLQLPALFFEDIRARPPACELDGSQYDEQYLCITNFVVILLEGQLCVDLV